MILFYPKNGSLQQLDISDSQLVELIRQYVNEKREGVLETFLEMKSDEIKQQADKLRGKVVLDCCNIIQQEGVYHI